MIIIYILYIMFSNEARGFAVGMAAGVLSGAPAGSRAQPLVGGGGDRWIPPPRS